MSGPISGLQRVTTTARIVVRDTCHPTKVRTRPRRPMNKIALLNDSLRRTFTGGKVVMTDGVAALPEQKLGQLLERVRSFDAFTNDNDPHGEHDFGSVDLA